MKKNKQKAKKSDKNMKTKTVTMNNNFFIKDE